jgi:hypothetical protein
MLFILTWLGLRVVAKCYEILLYFAIFALCFVKLRHEREMPRLFPVAFSRRLQKNCPLSSADILLRCDELRPLVH